MPSELQETAYFLEKDAPVTVYVSDKETSEYEWGFVQFPVLNWLSDGRMLLNFQVAKDSAESYGKGGFLYFVSNDHGKSWKRVEKDEINEVLALNGLLLEDGTRLSVETTLSCKADDLPLPAIPFGWIPYDYAYSQPHKAYRFEDLPSELRGINLRRSPKNGIPYVEKAPITLHNDLRLETESLMPVIFFGVLKKFENKLLGAFYPSYDYTEDGLLDNKCGILLVSSDDQGHSWRQLDRLPYRPNLKYDPKGNMRGGFTEVAAEFLDDGSLLLALRTADATPEPFPGFVECGPLYVVKRSQLGVWGIPKPISPFGVMPQLLKLKNGVIVLSYGRPGVQVRLTCDGGLWSAPYDILEAVQSDPRAETCGYSSIVEDPLDSNAFFIAYSNFLFEGPLGRHYKSIQVQRCVIRGPMKVKAPAADIINGFDKVVEEYYVHQEGALAVQMRFLEGKLHGLTEGFYESGIPSFITPYKDGKLHGLQRFFSPEGYLIKSVPYEDHELHGIVRFFDSRGNILKERYYWRGKKKEASEFWLMQQHLDGSQSP